MGIGKSGLFLQVGQHALRHAACLSMEKWFRAQRDGWRQIELRKLWTTTGTFVGELSRFRSGQIEGKVARSRGVGGLGAFGARATERAGAGKTTSQRPTFGRGRGSLRFDI